MIPLIAQDIALATGGRLVTASSDLVVPGPVVIDSRDAVTGSLFVCLVGDHTDGHRYAGAAIAQGAVLALAQHPVDGPTVIVDDPVEGLGRLAADVLRRVPECRVVGVTGSSGKTSTKDMVAAVLRASGPTVAPVGSLNNEIGLPLTVLGIEATTERLVLEYSARGIGHIAYLCGIARPDLAVVLNVGTAHLGEFGSRAGVAAAKSELVAALAPTGTAILNVDDPLVAAMAVPSGARVVGFGQDASADVQIRDLVLDTQARPRFRLETPWGGADIALGVTGAHQAMNAAAAAAAALVSGVPLGSVIDELARFTPVSAHRMRVAERADGLLVVDDAYNANPESVRAALDALGLLSQERHGRRRWAVLGEMRELGPDSEALHRAVGAHAASVGVDRVVAVGADAAAVARGAAAVVGWSGTADQVPDLDAAVQLVGTQLAPADVVLVKASNAIGLWRVAETLLAGSSPERTAVGADT